MCKFLIIFTSRKRPHVMVNLGDRPAPFRRLSVWGHRIDWEWCGVDDRVFDSIPMYKITPSRSSA